MPRVVIEHRITDYPNSMYKFAPSVRYPEYRWDDISNEENHVYDMIRTMLYRYGLDAKNYGKASWNPFGAIIKKGDTVVIKPNWVEDKNANKSGGMECLVTNPSIVRAIIDYVYIALDGTGKIIVGDSPMPDCNLQNLLKKMSYTAVWKSCTERGIKIDVCDFREDVVVGFANEVVDSDGGQDIIVDLGKDSCFSDTEFNIGKYRNGIVDATKMNTFYHIPGHHRYGINKYDVTVWVGDARKFADYGSYDTFYFFNPFIPEIFRDVIEKIPAHGSTVIYHNPTCHQMVLDSGQFRLKKQLYDKDRDYCTNIYVGID